MSIKRQRPILTLLFALCCVMWTADATANPAWADSGSEEEQQSGPVRLSGKVSNTSGEVLAGVVIAAKNSDRITISDVEGRFSIEVPSRSTVLSFTCPGYRAYEITVGDRRVVDVTLENNVTEIDELIVTGYGLFSRSRYDGSASVIKTDNLANIPNQSVASMIQANATGVDVTMNSSQPGGLQSIRIRGYGSFNASNSPLFVVDGIAVMSGDINQTGRSSSGGTDIMSTINPADIGNITIIKDAAAASLWGSRAANGVVLITTKQGNKNRMRISASADFGFSDLAYTWRPTMGGEERKQFIYDSYVRKGRYFDGLSEADAIAYADQMKQADSERARPQWSVEPHSGWTDWAKEAFRRGAHSNQELSISGGSDRITYYSSFSHNTTQGLQRNQQLDRYTGRMNVTYEANDWLKMGGNLSFSDMTQSLGYDSNWYSSPMYAAAVKNTPSDPVFNPDGTYNINLVGGTSRNIVAFYNLNKNEQQVTRAFNTVFAEAKIIPSLTLKTTLSYDFTMSRGDQWDHPTVADTPANKGQTDKSYNEYRQMVWSSNLNYVKTFAERHNVDALLAYETMDYRDNFLSGRQLGFLNYNYTEISNGSVPASIGGYYQQDRMVSYISRLNYNFDHKYYIGGSFRRDGTSRLHPDSRWGNFWSVSGGWRFTGEEFMAGISEVLTHGKLRLSYGANGTRPSDRYAYMSLSSLANSYNGSTALLEGNIANNAMLWESNYSLNVGLDLTIKNRVDVTVEFYNRTTKNLLMARPISLTTGFSSFTTNIGSVRNTGVEFSVNSTNIDNRDFSWNTQFNASHNQNKILKLDGTTNEIIDSYRIQREGLPYYQYYVIEYSHVDPETGRALFFMNNELPDGSRNRELTDEGSKATKIPYKSPLPKVTMGLTNTFRWKIIDLSFTLSSTLGGYSLDRAADKTQTSGSGDGLVNQIPTYYRDSWKQPGDVAEYEAWIPGTSSTYRMSEHYNSRRIHSTDHLRLKNLTFGVSLPRAWTQKIGMDQVRVYLTGQNLLTWAAYGDYDPEVPADGSMWYNTPPLKSYSVGLNINF